ncbi:segregation/condensation protein A [Deferribacterales bacterium Es71-Z0220]|jgi:segregation and condensation protein A|uniref:segregation and condensation protein A n=1 Tax=Deferrivibrio essentukiensis TaxID=2880922 RepID=UPI001F60C224|nr:segregation/condensation protein A [Deferrivibrio essentukiensis]MBZ4671981.1 Segregation and condensation protein [Deferribacteraceae bacterium]MCB4204149.1 segregation/condensation protein A [Deferrivibrio essentukiensis]
MNSFLEVKFENFEGPLDLLIHLIYKNEMSIYDISISIITDQFVEAVENMKTLDMNIAGEFIQMASYLLYLKSKMLLPNSIADEEDIDPEQEKFLLTQKIIEYSFYKDVSEILREKEFFSGRFLKRTESILLPRLEKVEADPYILANMLFKLLEKPIKESDVSIKKDIIDIETMIDKLKIFLSNNKVCFWTEIIKFAKNRQEVVVLFMAVLEMVKIKLIQVFQTDNFSDIKVTLYGQ